MGIRILFSNDSIKCVTARFDTLLHAKDMPMLSDGLQSKTRRLRRTSAVHGGHTAVHAGIVCWLSDSLFPDWQTAVRSINALSYRSLLNSCLLEVDFLLSCTVSN